MRDEWSQQGSGPSVSAHEHHRFLRLSVCHAHFNNSCLLYFKISRISRLRWLPVFHQLKPRVALFVFALIFNV